MKIFAVSLGIFLTTVSFGMKSIPGQPVESEATTIQRPLEKSERKFWVSTTKDAQKYLTASGVGVVTRTSFQYPGKCFYRYTPYVKNENGEIELSDVNEYFEDLFFEHKQTYHGGRIAFLGEDYKRYFYMSDRHTITLLTQEGDSMSLEDALKGLKFQLNEIGRIMKNIIPMRKNILYTDPNVDKHPDTIAIEREFSSDTHENREDSIVAKIGVVYPFDECLERLYLGLKEIGCLVNPSATPQTNPSVTPQTNSSATPQTNPSATPQTNPSATPQTNPSATPQTNPSATPQTNPSATPQINPSANSLMEVIRNLRKGSSDTEETTK